MSLLNDFPPRHYADITVPPGQDGKPLLATRNQQQYDAYIGWLADHLHASDIPLHPRQQSYAERSDGQEPDCLPFWISDTVGFTIWELEEIGFSFAEGESWEQFDAVQREQFAIFKEDDDLETSFEEWAVNRSAWERLREEWREAQALPCLPAHADIPFRALLSRALKRVPDRQERVRLLDRFFDNIDENASK